MIRFMQGLHFGLLWWCLANAVTATSAMPAWLVWANWAAIVVNAAWIAFYEKLART